MFKHYKGEIKSKERLGYEFDCDIPKLREMKDNNNNSKRKLMAISLLNMWSYNRFS